MVRLPTAAWQTVIKEQRTMLSAMEETQTRLRRDVEVLTDYLKATGQLKTPETKTKRLQDKEVEAEEDEKMTSL